MKDKKSFWDKLNPFEEKPVENKELGSIPTSNIPSEVIPNLGNNISSTETTGKSKEYFKKLMEELNIPGPDYFEFKKALDALKNLPEEVAFNSVYTTFNSLGVTKEQLLKAIDQYIDKIQNDKLNFENIIKDKITAEVTSLQEREKANNLKINELQKQIDDLKNQNFELINEATNNGNLINNGIIDYNNESKNILFTLESDKQKIINLIK